MLPIVVERPAIDVIINGVIICEFIPIKILVSLTIFYPNMHFIIFIYTEFVY